MSSSYFIYGILKGYRYRPILDESWQTFEVLIVERFISISSLIFYVGCLLYFGIREQQQILNIENPFIVFQKILH